MEEHPGDTLGKRFLTFWGSVAVIVAFGVVVYLVKGLFAPGDGEELDRGAATFRYEKRALVDKEQDADIGKYALDKAKNTVTIPTSDAIPYAAAILAQQKAEKSKVGVPGATPPPTPGAGAHDANVSAFEGKPAGAAPTPGAGAHDPNVSKFEGK